MDAVQLGGSDCEAIRDGLLAQPVNAVTSLAYVAVGAAVAADAVRRRRFDGVAFGIAVAAIGVGSVAFHGPQPPGARVAHDAPILIALVLVLLHDVGTVRSGRVGPAWPSGGVLPVVLVAVVLVSVALIASAPDLAQAVSAAVLVAVIALEVVIFHRRRRRIAERPPARSAEATSPLLLVVAVVATSAFLAGRTAGPLCDPTSPVQFHGLWHLVTAALAGLWWRVASGRSPSG